MKKEMLINVLQPEECRIAILEDGALEELYVERASQESYVGNVYKGRIVNIEPSIQAAFVDFGIGRNGFLHVSDVDPAYYRHLPGFGGHRSGDRRDRDREPGRDERRPQRDHGRPPRQERQPDSRLFEEPSRHKESPATRPQPEAHDDDFGAGLELPVTRTGREQEPMRSEVRESSSTASAEHDPYAMLASEFGFEPDMPESPEVPAPNADEGERRGRGRRGRGRRRGRTEESAPPATNVEPADVEFADDLPPRRPEAPQSPPRQEPDAFGAGLDLWGEEPPPPFMPGADRRTEDDDDFDDGPHGPSGGYGEDADDESEGNEGGGHRGHRRGHRNGQRRRGRDGDGVPKPPIQDIFKRGQEVLVQVIKEGIGTKGPTLSTYISIAGRYLVLMPGLSRIGVSRKIPDEEQRRRLKDILTDLRPPQGLGFIIRTAGMDRNKKELQNDLAYLLRIWQVVVKRIKQHKSPAAIYQESDMITRTIRDTFTPDVDAIWIDEPQAYQHALEFLQGVMPRYANRLKLFDSVEPLFHRYKLDAEIAKIQQKKLPLPNGGSIIIEQTEALVAIDVNSGNFRTADNNAEDTAFQVNLQAAKEIGRQLRLRDLGGVIVNDFIDMKEEKHRRTLEKALRDAVKRDRARTKILRISQFGIIEMTRQRIRPSLKRSIFQDCVHCNGSGHVKTPESMSIEVMRLVQLSAFREHVKRIEVRVHYLVADYLVNRRRREISQLEDRGGIQVSVTALREVSPERMEFVCYDANNNEVHLNLAELQGSQRPHPGHGRKK